MLIPCELQRVSKDNIIVLPVSAAEIERSCGT